MPADLVIYAVVAAGLIFWLKSILGTRHGDERERPNPFVSDTKEAEKNGGLGSLSFAGGDKAIDAEEQIRFFTETRAGSFVIDNKTAENGLIEIIKRDRHFELKNFVDGAEEAFTIIVESFAEGDRDTLKGLLGGAVYSAFEQAIKEREERQEKQETEIFSIRKTEMLEAAIKDRDVQITLKFTAEERTVTCDKNGNIVSGDPDKPLQMQDVWVFSRPFKSRDPKWLVIETRGGYEEDNEMLPNTDG